MADDDKTPADEVLGELARLLKAAGGPRPSRPKSPLAFLNSAFMVTVVGGAIVSLVGLIWQANAEAATLERLKREESFQRKSALLTDFSGRFLRSLDLATEMTQRRLWLAHTGRNGDRTKDEFPDGRSFEETRDLFEALKADYWKSGATDALCAEVRATFNSEPVMAGSRQLDSIMDSLIEYVPPADVDVWSAMGVVGKKQSAASKSYERLVDTMGDEVKSYLRSGE